MAWSSGTSPAIGKKNALGSRHQRGCVHPARQHRGALWHGLQFARRHSDPSIRPQSRQHHVGRCGFDARFPRINRTRNELASSLADAFARYQTQRVLLDYYRTQILQDQCKLSRHLPAIPAGRRQHRFQRCRHVSADIGLGRLDVHSSPGRSVAIGGRYGRPLQLDDLSQLDQFAARDAAVMPLPPEHPLL